MGEHRGGADLVHKVTLPSAIARALWRQASAAAGEPAGVDVYTVFVGDGSEVVCEVRTRDGKTAGKVSGKIGLNRFTGSFTIPESVKEDLYFEARLPKHGLSARSDLMRVVPPRSVKNARWDRKEAKRGDMLKLTAETRGIQDGTEVQIVIYEHDAGGAHDPAAELRVRVDKGKVEAEWEYGYHDKTETIPRKEEAEKGYKNPEYFFRVIAGGSSADSDLLLFKDDVEITLKDGAGKAVADQEYVLKLPDGSERRGKAGKDGKITLTDVPPGPFHIEFPSK
jgi:hypothetical protein